jgi:peroxiredoxin
LQQALNDIDAAGAQLVAISVDPPAVSDKLAAGHGFTFPIAADEDGAVMKAFGVFDPENEIAWPSIFVIEKDRTVSWRWIADVYMKRPPASDVVSAVRSRSP